MKGLRRPVTRGRYGAAEAGVKPDGKVTAMGYRIGVLGATGLVGEVLLGILEERDFPVDDLRAFASERSKGRRIAWRGGEVALEVPAEARFRDLDLVFTAAGSDVAREWVPRIRAEGPVVVDNSSAFRQEPDVPLVIPEINAHALEDHDGLIANPNCTATTALMAVAPLHRAAGVRAMVTSAYQSVSGTGRKAMQELLDQTRKTIDQTEGLRGRERLDAPAPEVYPHPIAFNVFPQCEAFPPGEDTSTEEAKMEAESRKILEHPALVAHATSVRVPVVVGHAVSVALSLDRPMAPEEARRLLSGFPGVRVVDDPERGEYPTAQEAAGIDETLVGRVRANPAMEHGLSLFVCQDNLRKGAALNNVHIAEALGGSS
ncbi:MAG TPA: aspartate-semialdehyde dehydrogenase [Actinomycetota bacterium]|nr:aspartate-semialdehyde dehydrogenase [Actinomycetota bacterium]